MELWLFRPSPDGRAVRRVPGLVIRSEFGEAGIRVISFILRNIRTTVGLLLLSDCFSLGIYCA